MNRNLYVLIHSPLVGAFTWSLVAENMSQRGLDVIVPVLHDSPDANEPYWKQHATSVARALADIPNDSVLTLVAHSGAGPLLPAIRQSIPNQVQAYVFADAGIPRNMATRLGLMKSEDANWAQEFQQYLEEGGRFPTWSSEELSEILPDIHVREQLVADLRPRALDFFVEPIPAFDGWPDAPCIYIQFSEAYEWDAMQARQVGWPTYKIQAGHFHMLVDPQGISDLIVEAVNKLQ